MRQSFAWWSFTLGEGVPDSSELLQAAAAIGYRGVEMLPEALWPAAASAGLEVVTLTGHELDRGFNDKANHADLTRTVEASIDTAVRGGIPFVIVFSGKRCGICDSAAMDHCVEGLAPLAATAQKQGVTLLLEGLNSKVDHPEHQCDHSAWGFEVVRRVDSPGLRFLYDVYHMQLMEGDLSNAIKANLDLIGHIHTAGAPGRRDLDDRQEVNWPGIAGLLKHLKYDGWVGHEFVPRGDRVAALRHAFGIFAGA